MWDLFRFSGDIVFDDHPPFPGQITDVQLKQFSETSNFLQCTKPLTKDYPYFFGQIRALSPKSRITIGIAGPHIAEDAHPGKWNETVGYHSYNGKCYTCHSDVANTAGEKFGIGDIVGVQVTYFGKTMSTVTFVKNGKPVATRYHYETDHNNFLPTITLENGPIDMGIMWPEAAVGVPEFDDKNMLQWMHDEYLMYDLSQELFILNKPPNIVHTVSAIQSPEPLQKGFQHYEMTIQDLGPSGASPVIGLATCSPLIPTPTSQYLRDFFRWQADGKSLKITPGTVVGMGVCYNPKEIDKPGFDYKAQQLVMIFVTFNKEIVLTQQLIQPEGGFYPLVALSGDCTKVRIDTQTYRMIKESELRYFEGLFLESWVEAKSAILKNALGRELNPYMFRSSSALTISLPEECVDERQVPDMSSQHCTVKLPADKMGVHIVQFCKPLSQEENHFCMEISELNEDSVISIGLADGDFPLTKKHPGRINNSTGWSSRDGQMYYNGDNQGHTTGERFGEGDTVELELMNFTKKWPTALFRRNTRAVGTRHYRVLDPKRMLPTIAVCGNGYDVVIHVYWQTKLYKASEVEVFQLRNWILPCGSEVDTINNIATVPDHTNTIMLQSPYPLMPHKNFDFFEIELIDDFDSQHPPAGVALSTGCFQEIQLTMSSVFRQEIVRFLAVNEAVEAVKRGDTLGWGMIIPESEAEKEEPLVILYLVIEKRIAVTRIIYQPQGGFYPFIILPPSVNRVKMTNTVYITSHPINTELQEELLVEAREIICKEKALIAEGKDPLDLQINQQRLFHTMEGHKNVEMKQKLKTPQLAKVAMAATVIERKRAEIHNSKSCVIL